MERVLAPRHRHVVGRRARLEAAVEPAEPVRDQFLTPHVDVVKARSAGVPREIPGRERVDVDELLEVMVAAVKSAVGPGRFGRPGTEQPAPGWCQRRGTALRDRSKAIAEPRWLAGERDPATRPSTRLNSENARLRSGR